MGSLRIVCILTLATGLGAAWGCSIEETSSSSGSAGAGASTSSNSATSTGTSTNSSSSVTTGGGTLTCSAEYTNIPKGDCDLLAQDCPEGMWCDVSKDGTNYSTKCAPAGGGLKDKGVACSGPSECQAGLKCAAGKCTPYCCPDTDQPCDGGSCNIILSFDEAKMFRAFVCSYNDSCELFKGDCPGDTECHVEDPDAGLAVCHPPAPSAVGEGEQCEYVNDCGDSMLCNKNGVDNMDPYGKCRHLCDSTKLMEAAGKGGCLEGRECVPVTAQGFPNLGICMLPG